MNISRADLYVYTPASTDVTIRWKLRGWIPPTQDPVYQKKWADFRKISAAGIESLTRENPINILKDTEYDH